jgi:hypothetical protein
MNPVDILVIQNWVNNEFHQKIFDDDWLYKHLAIIKVGHERGEDSIDIMRTFLASAVCDAAGLSMKGN